MRPAPLEVCHILRPYLYWRQAVQRCVDREVETPADGFYFFFIPGPPLDYKSYGLCMIHS